MDGRGEFMGYHTMTTEQLGFMWMHMKAGASNRAIAQALGFDRKTVNLYTARIRTLRIPPDTTYEEALRQLAALLAANRKSKPSTAALEPHTEEIRILINGDRATRRQEMRPKTAWLVIRERHGLESKTSYETFKRFIRHQGFYSQGQKATIRIETNPGDEIQVDYGKMSL